MASNDTIDDQPLARTARRALQEGVRVRHELTQSHLSAIVASGTLLRDAVLTGHKVLLCGNGGSAGDAQHIAAELVGRYVVERRALPAIALTTDTSALTAIGNDYGYEYVFSRQVEALGRAGDVLVAITTSGKSANILAAIRAARELGMKVVTLAGAKGAELVAHSDAGVAVPSMVTARIQECHIAIGHVWCELLDEAFCAPSQPAVASGSVPPPSSHPKIMSLAEAREFRERCRARKQTVVWTNGVFDVFHIGHLQSLRACKAQGDILLVGLNTDATVRRQKGPTRPIFPVAERAQILAALELVDAVVTFDEDEPSTVLAALTPDIHCKGADYQPPDGKPMPEAAVVANYGGRIAYLPLVPERSSTSTIEQLLRSHVS